MSSAFVTFGGWDGHRPRDCAEWVADCLSEQGFAVVVSDDLEIPSGKFDLVVPVWSLAEAPSRTLDAFVARVLAGTGLIAFHGAAGTFHTHNGYRHLLGGTFVWHPEERLYRVSESDGGSFELDTEQYYMHVDPVNDVVATTTFPNQTVMPIAWRRSPGQSRVFYTSLGHTPEILDLAPVKAQFVAGALWAAEAGR